MKHNQICNQMQNFGLWHLSKMKVTTFSGRREEAGKKEKPKHKETSQPHC